MRREWAHSDPARVSSWQIDMMIAVIRGFLGVAFCSAVLVLATWRGHTDQREFILYEPSSFDGSVPLQKNSLLQFQVPLSELDQTKVGEIVSGQVPYGSNGRKVAFTGQVTNGYGTSTSTGSLTVRLSTSYQHSFGIIRHARRRFAFSQTNMLRPEQRLRAE